MAVARIAVMPDASLTVKNMADTIPQAVLIDRQGLIRLIKVGSGEANAKALEAAIRRSLDLPVVPAGEQASGRSTISGTKSGIGRRQPRKR